MNKLGQILAILSVVVVVAIAAASIIFNSEWDDSINYVQLSVNPKCEFICKGDEVQSVLALNEEAKELLVQENLIGLEIEKACSKFVDLCAKAGYIDVNGTENAVKVSTAFDLTQVLEVKIYRELNDYFKSNKIVALILEGDEDQTVIKNAKENQVSPKKYILLDAYTNLNKEKSIKELKGLSQGELIKKISEIHKNSPNPCEVYTEEEVTNKRVLIDFNRVKYEDHMSKNTDERLSTFAQEYNDRQPEMLKKYQPNFDNMYEEWKAKHENYVG